MIVNFVEHSGILVALDAVGINSEFLLNNENSGVFLGWSSRSRLILNPSYAWLSLPVIDYVRLPQSRSFLLEKLKNTFPLDLGATEKDLFSLVGQWNWGVRQLKICWAAGRTKEAIVRLSYIGRFAMNNWPGWYDSVISQLGVKMIKGSADKDDILKLSKEVSLVAALEKVKPICSWVSEDEKLDQILAARDCFFYLGTDGSNISDLGNQLTWCDQFEADILQSELSLKSLGISEEDVLNLINHRLKQFKASLQPLKSLSNSNVHASAEFLQGCLDSIELINTNLRELMHLYTSVRSKLNKIE